MLHGLRGHVRVPRAPLGAADGDLAVAAPARGALLAGIDQGPFCPVPEERSPCALGSQARDRKEQRLPVKGTLAASLLLVFASALLCVLPVQHPPGHLLVVPPALSQQFQRGPIGPVCTWRARVPVPSPGHRHRQCLCETPGKGMVRRCRPGGSLPAVLSPPVRPQPLRQP